MSYNRDISELEKKAAKWWPDSLKAKTAEISVIPLLLESQDSFISILRLCKDDPAQIFTLLEAANFPANLFLKQLVVLADYGAETIQRLNKNFPMVFSVLDKKTPKHVMNFVWKEKQYTYEFEMLPIAGALNNKRLGIDGVTIIQKQALDALKRDMIMILLHGATSENTSGADLEKCEIGMLLGTKDELDKYVKQKYIWVSRITGGAIANTQGQIAQTIVADYLRAALGDGYKITRNGMILLAGYSKAGGMPFDIVVEKERKKVGVEVSFQVTTNSTIERKGGQAQERHHLMQQNGYKIAYVIDGAGNFMRKSAVSTICQFSDCTVAYKEDEFAILAQFLKEVLNG